MEFPSPSPQSEKRALDLTAAALACVALSLAVYGLALSGRAKPLWIGAAIAFVVAATLWRARPQWKRPRLAWVAFVPLLGLYLAHAWGPEIQPDAAGYHLGLTAEWLRDGRLPSRVGFYEVLPQGMEMLFGAAMAFGGQVAARLLHLAMLLGCAGLIMRLGAQPAAALMFFAIPVAAVSGTSAYTDAAQVFFALAAMVLLEEERPFAAGLCAGFVYAVKISGLVALPAGVLYLLWRGRRGSLPRFLAGAALTVVPWMARAVWLTGNPVAPLANRLFVNDAFHVTTDESFLYAVQSTVGAWWRVPWAVTVEGFSLQGLLGPVFLIVPLIALMGLKSARGRMWLAGAALFAIPWLLNPGARFALLPAAFLCLAISCVLPARVLWALATVHAALSLPVVMDRYVHPQAWRLRGWRQETPKGYFDATDMVNRHVGAKERVLDLVGLPFVYLKTVPVGPASSAEVDQLTSTLFRALGTPPPTFALEAAWPGQFVRALRVRAERPPQQIPWSVTELVPMRGGSAAPVLRNWFVDAWPVPADAALAVDGNPASAWQTWQPASGGAYVELRFDRPVPLDGARLLLENYQTQQGVKLYVQAHRGGAWREVATQWKRLGPSLPRRAAMAFLRSREVRWIVAKDEAGGFGDIGKALRMAPEAWGVEAVDRADNVWLFRVR